MNKPDYLKIRHRRRVNELTGFILETVLPDEFSYQDLEEMKSFVCHEILEHQYQDEVEALCEYLELGNWFMEAMWECDFDVFAFFGSVKSSIEWRNLV